LEPLIEVLAAAPSAGDIDGKRAEFAMVVSLAMIPEFGKTEGPIIVPPQPTALVPANSKEELRRKVLEIIDYILQTSESTDATVVTDVTE